MKFLEGVGGAGFEVKPPFQSHNSESGVIYHVKTLQAESDFRGSQQPFQPNPAEQQAAERLGKPPPEGMDVVFRSGSSRPERQGHSSRKPETLPRSKKARVAELIGLCQEEIHLPNITKNLTPEEEEQLQLWVNSLTYKQLGEEIRKRREKLEADIRNQWPTTPGLAIP